MYDLVIRSDALVVGVGAEAKTVEIAINTGVNPASWRSSWPA